MIPTIENQLTYGERERLFKLLKQKEHYDSGRLFYKWFDFSQNNYLKHKDFFKQGSRYKERAFLAGNRVGKTQTGSYEVVCHLTGIYPDNWEGRVFTEPTSGWVVGKSSERVRDTSQLALLGPMGAWGTGMIPRDLIIHVGKSTNASVDYVQVKHKSGGTSIINFKSNDAGRQAFEGGKKEFVWIDEECDYGVYEECRLRTMTTGGVIFTTFTPQKGLTPLILSLLQNGNLETPAEGVSVTNCGWDDVSTLVGGHLTPEAIEYEMSRLPPWQRLSRSRGIPSIGQGAIYPMDPDSYTLEPFVIPENWPRLIGMDVGYKKTAALWIAINPEDNVMYAYSEYYAGRELPVVHATAIKGKSNLPIPVVIDTAAHGGSQKDGEALFDQYQDYGLDLHNANKAVETGLTTTWSALAFGQLKIFNNCSNLLKEMKAYRRDENGKIIKADDHLCDCMRYAVMTKDEAKSIIPKVQTDNLAQYRHNPYTKTGF